MAVRLNPTFLKHFVLVEVTPKSELCWKNTVFLFGLSFMTAFAALVPLSLGTAHFLILSGSLRAKAGRIFPCYK